MYSFQKKKENLVTLCSIKHNVFHLAWNGRVTKVLAKNSDLDCSSVVSFSGSFSCNTYKCPVVSSRVCWLTVVILLITISPCSVGARRPYRNSAKIEVPWEFSTKFYTGRLCPYPFVYHFWHKNTPSVNLSLGKWYPLFTAANALSLKYE